MLVVCLPVEEMEGRGRGGNDEESAMNFSVKYYYKYNLRCRRLNRQSCLDLSLFDGM